MPRIRVEPEDFVVEEEALYPPIGEGNHTHLWIEKRLRTTDGVARELAQAARVPAREVGYAGRKDRVAVTRQWFSVPELDPAAARSLELRGARVLDAVRHPHRLRVGQLRSNRFRLRVRDVDRAAAEAAGKRLDEMARHGMPNRFGQQRFGRDGANAERGAEILRRPSFHGDRRDALLMVSALQSAVFNQVLDERAGRLGRLLDGDVVVVHATGGHFVVRDLRADQSRAESFEVSPTGPIFGTKMLRPRGEAAALEAAVMERFGLPPLAALEVPRGLRVYGDRRSLRIRITDVRHEWSDGSLLLELTLPSGSFATVLVEELFPGRLEDASGGGGHPSEDADEAH